MEGCSKRTAGAESGIPDGPLLDILSRVPAKSVCRFKCVSKAWRDLIEDPDNRKKLRQPMQGLFVQTWEYSEVDEIELNHVRLERVSFSFIDLTVRSVPLDSNPCFSFLKEMTGIETLCFKDSCNGLILFRHYQEWSDVGVYIVYNPTTKQWSAVPACGSGEPLTYAYLAFDPAISSHFHLVQLQTPHWNEEIVSVHVYSSETGTWCQNLLGEHKEKQGQLGGWNHQFTLTLDTHALHGAFVNGFLHVIVWGAGKQHILVVDTQGKARRMITVPGIADGRQRGHITCYLGQSHGRIHCVTIESTDKNNANLSTWVLQDYDTQEWVLKSTVNSLDVFGETVFGGLKWGNYLVVDIHQDSNVLFFSNQLTYELIAYDMDRKEVSVIATFKERKLQVDFARCVPYFSESPALKEKH